METFVYIATPIAGWLMPDRGIFVGGPQEQVEQVIRRLTRLEKVMRAAVKSG